MTLKALKAQMKALALSSLALVFTGCEVEDECKADFNTPVEAGLAENFKNNVGDRVYFHFDSYKVTPGAQTVLKQQADWLNKNNEAKAVVEGRCDIRGTEQYNLALGERRANSAKNGLVAAGVDPARLSTISYGKSNPVDPGHTEEAHARNRSATTVVQ